ncbi:hypothetical protein XM25_00560 [Devosia sp. H5989]|nr:hypothetical protein XM25_00560 [Devosia sp. H5989]
MARIIQFQGRRIQVPDAATEDQVREILQRSAGGGTPPGPPLVESAALAPAPATVEPSTTPDPYFSDLPVPGSPAGPAPEEQSLVDMIAGGAAGAGGVALQGLHGVATGIENFVGLPGDLVDALGISDGVPIIGQLPTSRDLNTLSRLGGILPERSKPSGPLQTVVNRVGEELGANLLPVAGVEATAIRRGLPAIREAGGWARYLLEPAAVDPAKFAAKEMAAAGAAGLGAGAANLAVDRNTVPGQFADLVGALSGATLYGAGAAVGRGAGQVLNALRQNPNYIDQTVKDAVVDRILNNSQIPGVQGALASDPLNADAVIDAIMSPTRKRPSEVIPGYQESLADVTGDPGLAALEYSRQSGPNAGDFVARRGANNELVDAVMRNAAPTETPGAFRSELEAVRDARLAAAAEGTQSAQDQFNSIIQGLAPSMLAEERGNTIRQGLQNAERAARDVESAAWRGIDAQVEPGPLADTLDQTIDRLSLARRQNIADVEPTAGIPRQLAGAPDAPNGPTSIQELIDMRSALLREQRVALSGPQPDRNRGEAIGQLIDDINAYLDSDAVPLDVRQQTDQARAVSRDVNERFNRPNDPISSALSTSQGRPDLPDSAVGPTFVKPDSKQASNIDRLLAETDLTSHGASVREAVKDEILSGAQTRITDPDRLEQYLNQFTRAFDRFPDLREEVRSAISAGRALNEAGAAETTLVRDVGSADGSIKGKSPVGRYLQYSDAQPEKAINEVLNAKDPGAAADELLTFIGDNPRAVEGARAAFWQKLKTESQSVDNAQRTMGGTRAWRGDWLKSFLDNPATAAVAERLYKDNPEALANLRDYATVLDNVDLRQRGKAVGTSGTAQGVNPVLTPETLQSRFYAYMRGQVSGTYLATSIAAVVARRAVRNAQSAAIDRLTDRVLLNPDLAAELLKENNPANRAALARKAKLWLGNEASTVLDLINGNDEETE